MALSDITYGSFHEFDNQTTRGSSDYSLPSHSTSDILLVFCGTKEGGAWGTTPSGWTLIESVVYTGQDNGAVAYYKIAGSGSELAPTVSWTSGSDGMICGAVISGVDTTTPIAASTSDEIANLTTTGQYITDAGAMSDMTQRHKTIVFMSANNKGSDPGVVATISRPYSDSAALYPDDFNQQVGSGGGPGHCYLTCHDPTAGEGTIGWRDYIQVADANNKSHEWAALAFALYEYGDVANGGDTPVVESWDEGAGSASGSGEFTITLPSGVAEDDYILVLVGHETAGATTVASGYTELIDGDVLYAAYKQAGASEGNPTFTHAPGDEYAYQVYRISGASTPTATTNTVDCDPPQHTGGTDYMWFAAAATNGGGNSDVVIQNSNTWENFLERGNTNGNCSVVVGYKGMDTTPFNPNNFLTGAGTGATGESITISFAPDATGPQTVTVGLLTTGSRYTHQLDQNIDSVGNLTTGSLYAPEVQLVLTVPALTTGSRFAPTALHQNVVIPLLSTGTRYDDHSVQNAAAAQDITLNTFLTTGTRHAPEIQLTVTVPLLTTGTLYAPAALDQNIVTPLHAGTTLHTHQLDQNLTVPLLTTGTLLAPSVEPTVTVPLLTTGSRYAPAALDQNVVVPLLQPTTLHTHALDQNVTVPLLTTGSRYTHTLTQNLTVPLLTTGTLHTHAVDLNVVLPLLSTGTLHTDHSVTLAGAPQDITLNQFLSTGTLYTHALEQNVAVPLLTTGSRYTHTLDQNVTVPVLQPVTLHTHALEQNIVVPLLTSGSLFAPTVSQDITVPLLQPVTLHTHQLNQNVTVPLLSTGTLPINHTVELASVEQTITVALHSATTYPTHTLDQNVTVPVLTTGTLHAPSVEHTITVPALTSGSVYAPASVEQNITLGLHSGTTYHEPSFAGYLTVPLLTTGTLYTHALNQNVALGLLTTGTLHAPEAQGTVLLALLTSGSRYSIMLTGGAEYAQLPIINGTVSMPLIEEFVG